MAIKWTELHAPGLSMDDAIVEAELMFAGARLPILLVEKEGQPLGWCNVDRIRDCNHILFKDEAGNRERSPSAFLARRAERLKFIPKVLVEPDEVRISDQADRRIYIAHTLPAEAFAVVVTRYKGMHADFITAYDIDKTNPRDRNTLRRLQNLPRAFPPQKGKGAR